MIEWIKVIVGIFGSFLGDALKKLFIDRRAALITTLTFVLLALGLGGWSLKRADKYQRVVETSLAKNTENTPQTFKALESLILVDAEADDQGNQTPFKTTVEKATLSEGLRHIVEEADEILSNVANAHPKPLVVANQEITSGHIGRAQDAIITEVNEPTYDVGFLFLPARLLHLKGSQFPNIVSGNTTIDSLLQIKNEKTTATCEDAASPICDDVLITRNLTDTLLKATTVPVSSDDFSGISGTPEQAYVITENGINRIVSGRRRDSSTYRNQFRSSTVFPARPYYTGAFRRARPEPSKLVEKTAPPAGKIGDYFYVSEPYLDIGGNGIVVTLSRAYRYPGHSDGALCLDLKLTSNLSRKLSRFVGDLDGTTAEIKCTVGGTLEPSCKHASSSGVDLYENVEPKLAKLLATAKHDSSTSDVAGSFSFLKDKGAESEAGIKSASFIDNVIAKLEHPNNELEFIIPILPPQVVDPYNQIIELNFLAASLNVGKYLQRTAISGALALFCLGVALSVMIGSWAGDSRLRAVATQEAKDLQNALASLANVMHDATTPYLRLNNLDHIVDANNELLKFLGLAADTTGMIRVQNSRFEDWLADPVSHGEYNRVQNLRKAGLPVTPYTLTFRTDGGKTRSARVVSSVVPASATSADGLPETFGILV